MYKGTISVSGRPRQILVHGSPMGRTAIEVDGGLVYDEKPFHAQSNHKFDIAGIPAELVWEGEGFGFTCLIRAEDEEVRLQRLDRKGVAQPLLTAEERDAKETRVLGVAALFFGILMTIAMTTDPEEPFHRRTLGPLAIVGGLVAILFPRILQASKPRPVAKPTAGNDFKVAMGWRYIAYQCKAGSLCLAIEPMAIGADRVYVPDPQSWQATAPSWAKQRRTEILTRLKRGQGIRKLEWVSSSRSEVFPHFGEPVPGSVEDTPGGMKMEAERLFDAGSRLTHEQAHEVWHRLILRYCEAATGTVQVIAPEIVKNSVFEAIELPAMRSNPNVTLNVLQAASAENRVDELANELMSKGEADQLEEHLKSFNLSSLTDPERTSWYHLWGIAAFQRGDRAEALQRFEDAFRKVPASAQIAFSLGQELQYAGQPRKAFEIFDRFKFPSIPGSFALTQARYAYLWNELDRAAAYIAPIFEAYHELKIVDDHFVSVRGLPLFGQTWAYAGAVFELQGKLDELQALTTRATTKLHDLDSDYLNLRVMCVRQGNFKPLVDRLRFRLEQSAKTISPTGYMEMEGATIEALEIDEPAAGQRRLQAVTITPHDSPWLQDVRTLALAALANSLGDSESENTLLQNFRTNQPLLLEPDHAFNFRLLAYQEKLKITYQNNRRGHAAV